MYRFPIFYIRPISTVSVFGAECKLRSFTLSPPIPSSLSKPNVPLSVDQTLTKAEQYLDFCATTTTTTTTTTTMGTGSSPRARGLGHGVDHPPPYSAEVKERVELYLYSVSGLYDLL